MKKAKYILKTDVDEKTIYYNLSNGAMIVVDDEEKKDIEEGLNNPNDLGSRFWKDLHENLFIVDDDYDEIKAIKIRHWKKACSKDQFEVTIIPTLRCNEKCIYCYQRGNINSEIEMSDKNYCDVISFLKTIPNKNIRINWYGGEPTLCKEKILDFCQMLSSDTQHEYTYSISTNSTIYDYDFYKKMVEFGLEVVDTTIVGVENDFVKLGRYHSGGYKKVKENITKIASLVNVVVSINLCITNIKNVTSILDDFLEYSYLPIYFSFTRIVSYDNNPCKEIELDSEDYMKNVIACSNYSLDKGIKICDMSCFENDGVYCGNYVKENYLIAPGNYVFTCENEFAPQNAIGRIIDGKLELRKGNDCRLCIDPYETEECRECAILPYCNGGCVHMRKIGNDFCPPEKNYLEDYLKLYYRKNVADCIEKDEIGNQFI